MPYRIFLGALSLSAGHLGMSFAEVVERIMATEPYTVSSTTVRARTGV